MCHIWLSFQCYSARSKFRVVPHRYTHWLTRLHSNAGFPNTGIFLSLQRSTLASLLRDWIRSTIVTCTSVQYVGQKMRHQNYTCILFLRLLLSLCNHFILSKCMLLKNCIRGGRKDVFYTLKLGKCSIYKLRILLCWNIFGSLENSFSITVQLADEQQIRVMIILLQGK